jgi:hypothetical protein
LQIGLPVTIFYLNDQEGYRRKESIKFNPKEGGMKSLLFEFTLFALALGMVGVGFAGPKIVERSVAYNAQGFLQNEGILLNPRGRLANVEVS